LVEQFLENEGEDIVRQFIDRAKEGDARFLLFLMDRLSPKRKGRTLEMQLPKINDVGDIPTAIAAITDGLNDGTLTPEEASQVTAVFQGLAQVSKDNELFVRMDKVEAQVKQMQSLKE